jgi:type IV pilus assembly protein PilO
MWGRLSQRERVLVSLLAAIVVFYLLWVYVLQPQIEAFSDLRRELAMATVRLEKGRDVARSLERQRLAVAEAEKRFSRVAARFEHDLRDGAVLVDIGLEAARRGVAVTLVRPAAVIQEEHYLELPFEFVVRGDYPQVLEFIRKIENLSNLSEIRRLEVKALALAENPSASPLQADGRVQAELTVVLYMAPTPENKLQLEALAEWVVGRYNAYQAQNRALPYPGL